MLELYDKYFNPAMIKILQWSITNILETNNNKVLAKKWNVSAKEKIF